MEKIESVTGDIRPYTKCPPHGDKSSKIDNNNPSDLD